MQIFQVTTIAAPRRGRSIITGPSIVDSALDDPLPLGVGGWVLLNYQYLVLLLLIAAQSCGDPQSSDERAKRASRGQVTVSCSLIVNAL